MINAIAKELNVSPADLIGYRRPSIELNSLSDVIAVLYQLNKKRAFGLRLMCSVRPTVRNGLAPCGSRGTTLQRR